MTEDIEEKHWYIPERVIEERVKITNTLDDEEAPDIQCTVRADGNFILISAEGWSDSYGGPPILISNDNGELILRVWADINQEDCTHKINLRGALDSEWICPRCGKSGNLTCENC